MYIEIPNDVQRIIDKFYNNGYEAFMVGGCVRDALLKKDPMDYDITTSAQPYITEKLFSKTIPTGIKHGTITVLINDVPYEVTTYRSDGNYIDNRHPDSVNFVSNIKDDLSRRDFTINAFAYNNIEGLVDYFSGIEDLENKIIRTVGVANERFNEDALRMLRAIRFSSQLNFKIENNTYNSIIKNSNLIKNISNERIASELSKILLSSNANMGLSILLDTGILSIILPHIQYTNNTIIDKLPKDLSIRFAFLFLNYSVDITYSLLKSLKFDNKTIDKTILFINNYSILKVCNSKSDCKRLLSKIGSENISLLISLFENYNNHYLVNIRNNIDSILNNKDAIYIKDLKINGNIIKNNLPTASGKVVGDILNHLLNLVIDETIENKPSILLDEAKKYLDNL